MAKQPTKQTYIRQLKKWVEQRTGTFDDWLTPQLEQAAHTHIMLDKISTELENSETLVVATTGSTNQPKDVLNPLIKQYNDLQRTYMMQLKALGLNYETTPSKVTEKLNETDDDNKTLQWYRQGRKV